MSLVEATAERAAANVIYHHFPRHRHVAVIQGWRMGSLPENVEAISYARRHNRTLDPGELIALAILEALKRRKGFSRFNDEVFRLVGGAAFYKRASRAGEAIDVMCDRDSLFPKESA